MAEQLIRNQQVAGSTPAPGSNLAPPEGLVLAEESIMTDGEWDRFVEEIIAASKAGRAVKMSSSMYDLQLKLRFLLNKRGLKPRYKRTPEGGIIIWAVRADDLEPPQGPVLP